MAIGPLLSPGDVADIIETTYPLEHGINAAIALMDATLDGAGLSNALLHSIQIQLAAHFVAVADPRMVEESYAGARFRYETGKQGEGLASTRYGRAALSLDISGRLGTAGMKSTTLETY